MSDSDDRRGADPTAGEIIFYATPEGKARVEVLVQDETFWLTQRRMAELFGVEVPTINYHLKEIFESGELVEVAVIRNIRITAADGKQYNTRHYSLDAIISVGYRVNSVQATQFRIWATQTLKEFIVKGFVLDEERLELNKRFGKDYFDELIERIREIRASERRFYLKITLGGASQRVPEVQRVRGADKRRISLRGSRQGARRNRILAFPREAG